MTGVDAAVLAVVTEAENYWGYVAVGYGAAVVAIGGFALRSVRRGRRLARRLPPEDRRWL